MDKKRLPEPNISGIYSSISNYKHLIFDLDPLIRAIILYDSNDDCVQELLQMQLQK